MNRGPAERREDVTGARRMPWRREPTKGAASRDSPRGGAHGLRSGGARMGEPGRGSAATRWLNTWASGREPGELKHLSTPRRRNQSRDPPSSGERKGATAKPASARGLRASRRRGCRAARPGASAPGGEVARAAERHGKAGRRGLGPRTPTRSDSPEAVPE